MATYKTDWTAADKINFADWNRIESNMTDLANYLKSIQYAIPTLSVVTNRSPASIDYLSSINRIENNLESIHAAFVNPDAYLAKKTWTVGKGFDYTDVNRLEANTQLLKALGALIVQSYKYCGATTCGGGGLY